MANPLITLDLFLALAVVPTSWLLAACAVETVPYAATATALRRRALITTVLVVVAAAGTLAWVGVVAVLAIAGWSVREEAVLAVTLVATPAVAALTVSLPRLDEVRRAMGFGAAAPVVGEGGPDRSLDRLRRAAAEPAVTVPIQATAFGAVGGAVVAVGPEYVARPVPSLVLSGLVAGAAAVTWWRHARRYTRLADPDRRREPTAATRYS